MKQLLAIVVASFATLTHAEYIRTGPMIATVCDGLVIKKCSSKEVVAVSGEGGLYEPAVSFKSVSEHKGKNCWINTTSSSVISAAIKAVNLPDFYAQEDGKRIKISPDYVTFKCSKQ